VTDAPGVAIRVGGLVPAYRAAGAVGAVVREFAAVVDPIVVVDDGSDDDTGAVAEAAGACVVRHGINRGKGAALVTGLGWLAEHGMTHALTIDADGQHLPGEAGALLAAARESPEAIVVGERRKEGHAIRGINRLGNLVADTLLARIAGRRLPDTQSGFRVYPIGATLALGTRGVRYDFETEVLLRAARAGLPVLGVPVAVHYPPVAERVSHYRPVVDTARIVRTVVRVLAAGG
jgi:glycosyltransferase involved in cell wall biosynthesis